MHKYIYIIHIYIYIYNKYIYIYIYIHIHVFGPSQDSSLWLRLTSREQLMSPECSKHQVLSFCENACGVMNEQKIFCSHQNKYCILFFTYTGGDAIVFVFLFWLFRVVISVYIQKSVVIVSIYSYMFDRKTEVAIY